MASFADALFAKCFDIAESLWANLKASTFDELNMKLQLTIVYAIVAKYQNLWDARNPDNITCQRLRELDLAFRHMAEMKKGFIGTRVAVLLLAQQDGVKTLARATELPGLSSRMAEGDRNLFRANFGKLIGTVKLVVDESTPRFAAWLSEIMAASRLSKADLKANLDKLVEETNAAFNKASLEEHEADAVEDAGVEEH